MSTQTISQSPTAGTHIGNLFEGEVPVNEVLLGSEVGERSDWLNVNACWFRARADDSVHTAVRESH